LFVAKVENSCGGFQDVLMLIVPMKVCPSQSFKIIIARLKCEKIGSLTMVALTRFNLLRRARAIYAILKSNVIRLRTFRAPAELPVCRKKEFKIPSDSSGVSCNA
jgi:hypothetical protein